MGMAPAASAVPLSGAATLPLCAASSLGAPLWGATEGLTDEVAAGAAFGAVTSTELAGAFVPLVAPLLRAAGAPVALPPVDAGAAVRVAPDEAGVPALVAGATGTRTGPPLGAGAGKGRGIGAGSAVGAGAGSELGAGAGTGSSLGAGAGAGSSLGAGAGSSLGAGAGAGSTEGAGAGSVVGAGDGSGVGTGSGTGDGPGDGVGTGSSSTGAGCSLWCPDRTTTVKDWGSTRLRSPLRAPTSMR